VGSDVTTACLEACWLGRVDYLEASDLQERLQRELIERREGPGWLLLLEHEPVITAGRRASPEDLRVSPAELGELGVEFAETRRGGQLTYHGPGQLVGYPIIDLKAFRPDIHWYIRQLEEVLIRALRPFSVGAERKPGHTGVWVGERKIASIGVHIRRWVTSHGFALNVQPEMAHFALLNPCGLSPETMTSLAELAGGVFNLSALAADVAREFAEVFGLGPADVVFRERSADAFGRGGA
jgi:lipoate-protein ligase B